MSEPVSIAIFHCLSTHFIVIACSYCDVVVSLTVLTFQASKHKQQRKRARAYSHSITLT
jgi:hypothetical protein